MGSRRDPGERSGHSIPEPPNVPEVSGSSDAPEESLEEFVREMYPSRPPPAIAPEPKPVLVTEPLLELQADEDEYNNWH